MPMNRHLATRMLDGGIGERLVLVLSAIALAMVVYFGLVIATGAIDRDALQGVVQAKACGQGRAGARCGRIRAA